MPTRLYRPVRQRLTAIDHIRAHEWEVTLVAGLWTSLGILLCWTWISPGGGPGTVLSRLSSGAAASVAVVLLATGLLVLASILWRGDDRTALRMEMFALPLGASAWIAYATVSPSTFWRVIAAWFVIGCALRVVNIWLILRGAARPKPDMSRIVVIEE